MIGLARSERAVDRQRVTGPKEIIELSFRPEKVRSHRAPDASLCRRSAFAASTKRLTSGSDKSSIDTLVACCALTLTYYTWIRWISLHPQRCESRRTPYATHTNVRERFF